MILVVVMGPATARAYSLSGAGDLGCHELITTAALRAVRAELPSAAPVPAVGQDALIVEGLPFPVPGDMRDLPASALLVGVRDNDLKGRRGVDPRERSGLHGDPILQREHCLRRAEHDEPGGTELALTECRASIRAAVLHALDGGLDESGVPDSRRRTVIDVRLAFAGVVRTSLPVFWVYLGQALHTFQDSFSHAYRTPDHRRVRVLLNWIDFVADGLREERDGPEHMGALDHCRGLDSLRAERLEIATSATAALLRAVLDPARDRAGKEQALDAILDEYLSFQPGCTVDNRWCDAPEAGYAPPAYACECRLGRHGRASGGTLAVTGLLGFGLVLRRRRRTQAVMLGLLLLTASQTARAAAGADRACVPGQQMSCACPNGATGAQRCTADGSGFGECRGCPAQASLTAASSPAEDSVASRFGLHGALGGAVDHAAAATALGLRYRLAPSWVTGATVEWNPWGSFEARRVRSGVVNIYASVIRRYLVSPSVNARTSLHGGLSALTFDLYGAPAGSVGPFFGLSFIGIEVALAPRWRLILDPVEIMIPIPHLTGTPLIYNQYRFTIALQWGA